jgi:hypothetical protein
MFYHQSRLSQPPTALQWFLPSSANNLEVVRGLTSPTPFPKYPHSEFRWAHSKIHSTLGTTDDRADIDRELFFATIIPWVYQFSKMCHYASKLG